VYIDDLVRVSDRLTLDLGLRYEIFTPLSEVFNRISNYDLETKTLLLAGVNTSNTTIHGDYNNFGPRFGLAYALTNDKKTSLRAGYGIFYIPSKTQGGTAQRLIYNPPFAITQSVSFATSTTPTFSARRFPRQSCRIPTTRRGLLTITTPICGIRMPNNGISIWKGSWRKTGCSMLLMSARMG
ncbi:MAG: TonB-dependent receptor, partial [Bryobacteraceae bacterium]